MTPAALTDECAVTYSQRCVSFVQVWWLQTLKKWRYEHFPELRDYVTMTSPASGNACSLLWTYLNSCIYCPSLVTIALLENIFLLKRMKTFNSRNVVKVKHYFKWNAFKSLYSCKVAETITCCTYFLDLVIPLSSETMEV